MTKSKKTGWKEERPVYLWLAIAGALIAIVFYFIPKNARAIDEAKLKSIHNLILDKDPELKSRRSSEQILLHVKGYEKPFQVAGFDFNETSKRNILRNIKSGDTISVKTEISELNEVDDETFLDGNTEIHSLIKDSFEYLNIKRANRTAKRDLELGVPIGFFLLISGLFFWSFRKKPKFSPTIVISVGVLLMILMMQD